MNVRRGMGISEGSVAARRKWVPQFMEVSMSEPPVFRPLSYILGDQGSEVIPLDTLPAVSFAEPKTTRQVPQ